MGNIMISPSPLELPSNGQTKQANFSYQNVIPQSCQVTTITSGFTAEWDGTGGSHAVLNITGPVNNSTTDSITGTVYLSAFATDTQQTTYVQLDLRVLPRNAKIQLTPQRIDATGVPQTVNISAVYSGLITGSINLQNNDYEWVTLSFTDDTKTTISAVLSANNTNYTREAYPKVWAMSSQGSAQEVVIPIVQAPGEPGSITITPTSKTVNWIGSTTTADVELVNMGDIDITTNQQDWTSVSYENNQLQVVFTSNNDTTPRTALVTISGNDLIGLYRSATFTLNQIGKPAPGSISVDPTEVSVGSDSGETETSLLTINQILMGSISTGATDDWLTATVDETTGEVVITTLYKNPKNTTRTAILTISATENVWLEPVSCTVVVNQEPSVDYDAILEWLSSVGHTVDNLGDVWDAGLACQGMDTSTVGFADLPEWVGAVISPTFDKVTYTVGANTTTQTRSATFTLSGVTSIDGLIYEITYTITQGATLEAETFPVFEDKIVELPVITYSDDYWTNNNIRFKIVDINGDEDKDLFTGTVYNQDGSKINISTVIKSYLTTNLSFTNGWQTDDDAYKFFRLDVFDENNTFMPYKLYKVFNDWSYSAVTGGTCVSNPVIQTVDDRQYFVMSFLNRLGDNPTTVTVNGLSEVISDEIKHFVLKSPSTNVVVNGVTYPVKRTPYTYALYYRTKAGGWSWMLFNRASKQTDNVKRQSYKKQVYTFNPIEHATNVYGVEISSTWQLKTNFLTDSQSEKFQDIVASPTMWLHDLEKDEVIPVVMSTSKTEHLGWANNSKHKVRYTIEVESSRTKQNNS